MTPKRQKSINHIPENGEHTQKQEKCHFSFRTSWSDQPRSKCNLYDLQSQWDFKNINTLKADNNVKSI